jgi:hypothetical protein
MVTVVMMVLAQALPPLGFTLVGVAAAHLLFIVWRRDRASATTARALLRARTMPPDLPDGTFGVLEGSCDGALEVVRNHTASSSSWQETRYDQQGHAFQATATAVSFAWQEQWGAERKPLTLETDAGSVEIVPTSAMWSAPPRIRYEARASDGVEHFLKHADKKTAAAIRRADVSSRPRLVMRAEPGDSLVVAGRVRRSANSVTLQATGPGSLLMFSAPQGSSARSTLRLALIAHRAGTVLQLAIIGAAIAAALVLEGGFH